MAEDALDHPGLHPGGGQPGGRGVAERVEVSTRPEASRTGISARPRSSWSIPAILVRGGRSNARAAVVPQITDDFVRTVVGPDLEKVIEIRMEREANEAWARKYVEAWKRRGR